MGTPHPAADDVDGCPRFIIDQLVTVMQPEAIWLFGSRVRGTARPDSDWDLLLVLPDSAPASCDLVSKWNELRTVRREGVDLFAMRRSDFEDESRALGTLAQIAVSEGRIIYGR